VQHYAAVCDYVKVNDVAEAPDPRSAAYASTVEVRNVHFPLRARVIARFSMHAVRAHERKGYSCNEPDP